MLDEYGLQLLAEMGIDVYLPRVSDTGLAERAAPAQEPPSALSAKDSGPVPTSRAASAGILILGHETAPARMLADVRRALRVLGVDAEPGDVRAEASIATARGLLVFGEALARELGAGMPAQRQNELIWIVSAGPRTLARDATAKQALWGEIKRLARQTGTACRRN